MPARSIVANRNQLRQAREALRALPPGQREELHYRGIGPGDSYIGMWRMVNRYRYRLNSLDQEMRADTTTRKWRELEKHARYYGEQITFIYAKLLVHEKPKLASVEFKGDQQNPIYHEVDLKNLSDEDLDALARILPKLGGATGQGRDPGTARAPAGRARRPS